MLEIRKCSPADRQTMRKICLATCSDPFLLAHTDVLYMLYCDYYIDNCADSCFVSTRDGAVTGYILCAPDTRSFIRDWRGKYLALLGELSPEAARQKKLSLFADSIFRHKYPAHMHIDLFESECGHGTGTKLLTTLEQLLKERGIHGLYLDCGVGNSRGRAFYEKRGFKLKLTVSGACFYAKKL